MLLARSLSARAGPRAPQLRVRRLSQVPADHYDLRAAGADEPQPYEVNGEPTDITKSLSKGGKQIGYSPSYARSWDRIFARAAEAARLGEESKAAS
ncbi:hypothetical protein KFE25_009111 [Diacronema lutheri]|uniref:Uncharacterized protein n=1 Tax=Diacronema lutheri TaxID=2081491 RepID=A0A8J6CHW2_DIALT|nr:hypothetical protein KFE25_009111 [Diacronema lutheri]